jgi:hypothetical protein
MIPEIPLQYPIDGRPGVLEQVSVQYDLSSQRQIPGFQMSAKLENFQPN